MGSEKLNKIEFVCVNCGCEVPPQIDSSIRNHCPKCLYSLHVDIFPNDNANSCHALMRPIDAIENEGQLFLVHKCTFCDKSSKGRVVIDDNYEVVIKILNNKTDEQA